MDQPILNATFDLHLDDTEYEGRTLQNFQKQSVVLGDNPSMYLDVNDEFCMETDKECELFWRIPEGWTCGRCGFHQDKSEGSPLNDGKTMYFHEQTLWVSMKDGEGHSWHGSLTYKWHTVV